jgi:Xaa-Pro aminopeptidase
MDALDAAMKARGADAFVVFASSDDADIRYLTRFVIHDPFVFFKRRGQPGTIIVSQMECERASREATALVMSRAQAGLPDIMKTEKDLWNAYARMIAGQAGKTLLVSPRLPAALLRALEVHAHVIVDDGTVERMRAKKSPEEVAWMQHVQEQSDAAMALAVSLVTKSTVKKELLYYRGSPLTSEFVRIAVHKKLMDGGCRAVETIVSCGDDTALPHAIGAGQLAAHVPIVIDMFPKDETTGYYADMTRTVSKGEPDDNIREMYDAVLAAKRLAMSRIRAGVSGIRVYQTVVDAFKDQGYESTNRGFVHNLGHGVGLQVHELPTLGPMGTPLRAGHVITVEPGLYYPSIGGVRLEDMGLVTKTGFSAFTAFPEELVV